ncbi:MAG TPA: type VII secretion protein EccE [Mycobacteriales bacterium]|nr:type VII secretion protein EccE [Mycobacteriales bacterium]
MSAVRDPTFGAGPPAAPSQVPPASPPNTGAVRAVSRAHPVPESRPGRLFGLSVGQVLAWQGVLAAVLAAAVRPGWTLVPAGLAAVSVLTLTLVRQRGRWLYESLAIRLRFQARRRIQPPAGPVDPRLAALREVLPELDVSGIVLRSGERIGVAYDGRAWVGVVAVQDSEDVVPQPQQVGWLPVRELSEALVVDDIRLAAVQVLRYTVPAPAGMLPPQSPVAMSYQQLNLRRTPASQHLWVALRLDPALSPEAIEVRGGGTEGAQRAVKRCIARTLELLEAAGLRGRALDDESLRSVLALAGGVRAVPAPPGTRRTEETWTYWQGDGTVHITWWVKSWPDRGIPMQALQEAAVGVPSLSCSVSLTLHPVQTEGSRFRGLVRLSATSPAAADIAAEAFRQATEAVGIVLYRLDGEQEPGLAGTLPLGGGELA